MHKITPGSSENAQNPMRNFQKGTKSHIELCAFSEDPRGILCIYGSSMWDCVPFWKFLMGFCAFSQEPGVILCIFGSSSWDFVITPGSSENAQNPMRNFQTGTKSHKELPKMHKIPQRTSKNAQNPMRNFQKCTKSQECIFGSSS
jgi:hypothetical protein